MPNCAYKIRPVSLNFKTAVSDQLFKVEGKVALSFKIDNNIVDYDFYVISGLIHNVILGVDFFRDFNAYIDFKEHKFCIPDIIKTPIRQENMISLVVNKNIKLPKHSLKKYPVHLAQICKDNRNFILSGNNKFFPSDIISTNHRSNMLMLPLINNTDQKEVIKKGSVIAYIEQINESQELFKLKVKNEQLKNNLNKSEKNAII